MTEEKLERCGIPIGPATNLFEAIKELNQESGLSLTESSHPLLISFSFVAVLTSSPPPYIIIGQPRCPSLLISCRTVHFVFYST